MAPLPQSTASWARREERPEAWPPSTSTALRPLSPSTSSSSRERAQSRRCAGGRGSQGRGEGAAVARCW